MICLATTAILIWFSSAQFTEVDIVVSSIGFMASVAVSIWMLGDVDDFLSDNEHGLDLYARNAGFLSEWRRTSQHRLLEALSCLALMWFLRCLVYAQIAVSVHNLLLSLVFCLTSFGFMAVAYLELHVLCGLELAIDSFSVHFFRAMDVKQALAEWNVLQAMLRHMSTKLSKPLLPLGCACGASVLYLIELSFVRDVEGTAIFCCGIFIWRHYRSIFVRYRSRICSINEYHQILPILLWNCINWWTFCVFQNCAQMASASCCRIFGLCRPTAFSCTFWWGQQQ